MSVAQGAALTIGAVLGTGVISLPAMAAGIAGPASILAWLALVVLSAPLALTFAALGARFPDAGGVSTYARRAFGSRAATAVGWLFYVVVAVGAPPAAAFAGGYVADLVGGSRTTTMWAAGSHHRRASRCSTGSASGSPGGSSWGWRSLLAVLLTVATRRRPAARGSRPPHALRAERLGEPSPRPRRSWCGGSPVGRRSPR